MTGCNYRQTRDSAVGEQGASGELVHAVVSTHVSVLMCVYVWL